LKYDLIIVGGGPAGFWAAYEIAKHNKSSKNKIKAIIIEKGKNINERTPKDVMQGFGGAGTFSDGKLHFTPVLSHEKMLHLYNENEYQLMLDEIYETLKEFGVDSKIYPRNMEAAEQLVNKCKQHNIELFIRKTQHVGSDKLPIIIKKIEQFILEGEVEILCNNEVEDLIIDEKDNSCLGVKLINGDNVLGEKVFLAPGRIGTIWLQKISKKYDLPFIYGKVEVGVRVEFPSVVLKKYSDELYETVFKVYTPTYDDVVRTFCPCPNGYVAKEEYDDFVCVNGHSLSTHDSPNSNFALVTEISLTEPLEDSNKYAKSIAKLATTIGGGKPIVQRLGDLKRGRRSTRERINRSLVMSTLKEAVPGDISMALPARVLINLKEGIEQLDKVLIGLNSDSTLLYAPEIKLRSTQIRTNEFLMTNIKGLYVGGDAAGLSGNIIGAMTNGLVVGKNVVEEYENILKEKNEEKQLKIQKKVKL